MQKKIALFVTSVHLLMIGFLLFSPVKKTPPIKKHIAVRTIQPKSQTRAPTVAARPPKKAAASPAAHLQAPSAAPKATTKKESAKTAAPKAKASKPATSSKPAPVTSKPIPPQKKPAMVEKGKAKKSPLAPKRPQSQVLKEIDEALAKIDEKVYSKPQSKLNVPQIKGSSASQIPFPNFEEMFDEAGTDTDVLQTFFDETLKLPENGEVRIQLTIKKDGTVARLVVLEAHSQKNKAYLEKNIPLLKLPVQYDKETTIIFNFCNAR